MRPMSIQQVAEIVGGQVVNNNDKLITSVVRDSREAKEGALFVAIKGERTDGHKFIQSVFEQGATAVFCNYVPEGVSGACIVVEDTIKALQDLARGYRESLSTKVVGISGSVGKTSTKEIVAAVLAEKYKVHKTNMNFNNEIGLPLTVMEIDPDVEVTVLEMGISDFGEMRLLSSIAKPDVCVLTNIGQAHLEALGSRDGILRAKSEIFEYMNPKGAIFLNGDDDKLITIKDVNGIVPVHFGISEENDVYPTNLELKGLGGSSMTVNLAGRSFDASISVIGIHMVMNALAASAIGNYMGLTDDEIAAGLKKAQTVAGRCNLIAHGKGYIIDDCYNASPDSMLAALEIIEYGKGRKIALLGDMLELGSETESMHYNVGVKAAKHDIDKLICIGSLAGKIYEGAKSVAEEVKCKEILHYDDLEDFICDMGNQIKEDDNVLLKASNGMHFKTLIDLL